MVSPLRNLILVKRDARPQTESVRKSVSFLMQVYELKLQSHCIALQPRLSQRASAENTEACVPPGGEL